MSTVPYSAQPLIMLWLQTSSTCGKLAASNLVARADAKRTRTSVTEATTTRDQTPPGNNHVGVLVRAVKALRFEGNSHVCTERDGEACARAIWAQRSDAQRSDAQDDALRTALLLLAHRQNEIRCVGRRRVRRPTAEHDDDDDVSQLAAPRSSSSTQSDQCSQTLPTLLFWVRPMFTLYSTPTTVGKISSASANGKSIRVSVCLVVFVCFTFLLRHACLMASLKSAFMTSLSEMTPIGTNDCRCAGQASERATSERGARCSRVRR